MRIPSGTSLRRHATTVAGTALVLMTLTVFLPIANHGFVGFDDDAYVAENPWVIAGLSWEGAGWAFSAFHAGNWHPLTWLSHMTDVSLFGLNPGAHHLVSLLFHLLNTVFLYAILRRMTGEIWKSVLVAALFGIHPLHVESVAWIAERKDVLSTLFFILCLWAYGKYIEKPSWKRYLPVFFSMATGLLAKPMLVTLPFVLLLLDYWPLRRFHTDEPPPAEARRSEKLGLHQWRAAQLSPGRLFLEKLPLLVLSAVSCFVTWEAQSEANAMGTLAHFPPGVRLGNAVVSYASYVVTSAWPLDLAVFYPLPPGGRPWWMVLGAGLLVAALSLLAFRRRRSSPFLIVGWLWYLGTLIPVLGIVQVGAQAMADRYTYIPLVGVFVMATWSLPAEHNTGSLRGLAAALSVAVIIVLSFVSGRQVGYWRDGIALGEHATEVTRDNWMAHNNLGAAYVKTGRYDEATRHFRESLRIRPQYFLAHRNVAWVLSARGRDVEATIHYREAVRLEPMSFEAQYELGTLLNRLGSYAEATNHLRIALQLRPWSSIVRRSLGSALERQGRIDDAIEQYREAVRLDPTDGDVLLSLDQALSRKGRSQ